MLDRAVDLGRLDMAKRWLYSLPERDQNDPAQRARLWELARQDSDSPLVRKLGNQIGRPCLETAEWLSRHDPAAAREQLEGCRAEDGPQTWLVLAQRLGATASFFDQDQYRNDWRVDESEWNERFLYLDAAWWTRAGDHAWLSRYQQGRAYKLPVDSPQTLMPYGFLEFSAQDPSNDWRQDWRTGVGLRWQYWYGDDRYNAYRAHVSVRTEYQWALGGNLYEQANGVLVGVEVNF